MIVLTGRESFGGYLRGLFQSAPEEFPAVSLTITKLISDDLVYQNGNNLLVVDLADNGTPDVVVEVRRWRHIRPEIDVVAVLPWLRPRHEAELALKLSQTGKLQGVMAPDDCRPHTWYNIVQETGINRVGVELRRRLVLEVSKHERTIVEPNRVLGVLNAAPRVSNVDDYCRHTGIERRSQERLLRQQQQRQTKELLLAFRWLWAVALREEGWKPGAIAHALGYPDSSEAAKALFRTIPVGLREFTAAGSARMIEVFAEQLLRTLPGSLTDPLPELHQIATAITQPTGRQFLL